MSDSSETPARDPTNSDRSESTQDAGVPRTPGNKPWSIQVYLAGDNDLSQAALQDVEELTRAGASPDRHVLVQLDTKGDLGALRYAMTEPRSPGGSSHRTVMQRLDEQAAKSSMRSLRDFVIWSRRHGPAESAFLVIWGHGRGWRVAPDVTGSGGYLTMPAISEALTQAGFGGDRRLDVLAFDACLMATVENAHHLRKHVELFVSSQTLVPEQGLPYVRLLNRVDGASDAHAVALACVSEYVQHYEAIRSRRATSTRRAREGRVRRHANSLVASLHSAGVPVPEGFSDTLVSKDGTRALSAFRSLLRSQSSTASSAVRRPAEFRRGNRKLGMSVVETTKTDELIAALDRVGHRLSEIVRSQDGRNTVVKALRSSLPSIYMRDHRDVALVARLARDGAGLTSEAEQIDSAREACVLHVLPEVKSPRSLSGLSVWFPADRQDYLDRRWQYLDYACCREYNSFGWLRFLDAMHGA